MRKIRSIFAATLLFAGMMMLSACDKDVLSQAESIISGLESSTANSNSDSSSESESTSVMTENPTIYLAGDSTVKTYADNQYIGGWGQYLDSYFDDDATIINCAQGGRSSRSFINEGRLYNIAGNTYTFDQNGGNSLEDVIEAGDYLFIQFGHNDDDTKMESSYATVYDRMSPLGTPDGNGIYPTTVGERVSNTHLPDV